MNCPVCTVPLQMTDRSGVEVDYCPTCRGVWLDRGELDKIIERSETAPPARTAQSYSQSAPPQYRDDTRGHDGHHRPKKRKESFLGDLFDF